MLDGNYWRIIANKTNGPLWIDIVSGFVCILSIIGSLAIILTYLLVKDIRSKARELLVHIALMDLTYSTANLIGLMLPYREHFDVKNTSAHVHHTYHNVCEVQAVIAVYGTIGSVLWTLGLAVYLYYRIVSRDAAVTGRLVRVLYVVCYVLPIYVSLWLLLTNKLGYSSSPSAGGGWCSVRDDVDPLENFMTYDIWMWLGITILIPLYLSIHIHIRAEMELYQRNPEYYVLFTPLAVKAELKLLFVPLVFIFLRVWDVIGSIIFVYAHYPEHDYQHFYWLQFLTSVGDCGQGIFNFIIFFLLQPRLRALLINVGRYCCCCCCYCCRKNATLWWRQLHDNKKQFGDTLDESCSDSRTSTPTLTFSQYTT